MRIRYFAAVIFSGIVLAAGTAGAHFGMLIPSQTMLNSATPAALTLRGAFAHPREGIGMPMAQPKEWRVWVEGQTINLEDQLKKIELMGQPAWELTYTPPRPGVYVFHLTPTPYWEPSEDCYIIHYTKTVVAAYGADSGWDQELGLKTEIVPLSRPYGLYAGNLFQGVVKLNGQPAADSMVEVEYYDDQGGFPAENDYMITQTVKTDAQGRFAYAVPHPGWWGFAALNSADFTQTHEGEEKEVELGAVIWVYFHPWPAP
ncbi:MAG: DUF4198 domain-containing protein [Desulfobacterales bacterium]|jgi:cobalt/nickel transport protein